MIAYEDLDPARIERAAKMLITDLYPSAESIDGSGGDDAQDLRSSSPDGLVIFEVKSFTRRLTPAQRRQIKASLLRAVELHSPAKWVLVVPLDHSPKEREWFHIYLAGLAPEASIEWWGRAWFDRELAKRGDLVNFIEGPYPTLLRRAKEMMQEETVLAGGAADLADRAARLAARVDDISPYWRWDTITRGTDVTLVLAAKRRESEVVDPIELRPQFSFPIDDPAAQAASTALRRALGFGGDVTIPAKYVVDLQVLAASQETRRLLGDDRPKGDLRFVSPVEQLERPLSFEMRLAAPNGTVRRTLPVMCSRLTRGTSGGTYVGADPSGVLEVRLILADDDSTTPGRLELQQRAVAGRLPHEVLPALEFLTDAELGDTVVLVAGPEGLGQTAPTPQSVDWLRPLARYVRALARLQEHGGCLLPIPEDPGDDQDVVNAAALLDGERVLLPWDGLNISIRAGHVRNFIAEIPEVGTALYASQDLDIEIGGQRMELGSIAIWAPAIRLANRAELEAVADSAEQQTAEFRCIDGERIYWMPAVADPGVTRSA